MSVRTVLIAILLINACSPAEETGTTWQLHPGGKADDFYSTDGREFRVSGWAPLRISAEDYVDESKRKELVEQRLLGIAVYLTVYLGDKFEGNDVNGDGAIGEDEVAYSNREYGGFHAMVRNPTMREAELREEGEGEYAVRFEVDVAGPADLPRQLAGLETAAAEGQFTLRMPRDAGLKEPLTMAALRTFDPAQYQGELEALTCDIAPLRAPLDAYPRFDDFFQDGALEITLYFGHDYMSARHDLAEAREIFDRVRQIAPKGGVERFEDLRPDSPPFYLFMPAGGQQRGVHLRLYHADLFKGQPARHRQHALAELVERDVFIFSGHAGPFAGLLLGEDDESELTTREIVAAPFTQKEQLFAMLGCKSYSQYADLFYAHPKKSEHNLDVITAVNFSIGSGAREILDSIFSYRVVDDEATHDPPSFGKIIGAMNEAPVVREVPVIFGVTGIDQNPRLHPYADAAAIGRECSRDRDCGDWAGNFCVEQRCHARMLAGGTCPEGSQQRRISSTGEGPAVSHLVCGK